MFPESKIAKSFSCAQTKTTQILNWAMLPELKSYVVIKAEHFIVLLMTGQVSLKKMNSACALIIYFKCSKQVKFKCFDMCFTTGENASTADTLFQSIQGPLNQDDVSCSNCVSSGVDNCNTNIGARNY